MDRFTLRLTIALITFFIGIFAATIRLRVAQVDNSITSSPVATTTSETEIELEEGELEFPDENRLSFRNYEVVKLYKNIAFDLRNEKSAPVEVSFAELRRDSKTIAVFDGVYHPMGNKTDFGMFDLLGKDQSQLVVEQSVWRGGRQWVYDFSTTQPRLIFDSDDWGTGREDFRAIDLDADGKLEILKLITDFYELQDKFAIAFIPMPTVVFKYDERQKKYLPANPQYLTYILNDVPPPKSTANSNDIREQARIVRTLLDYVFAGQRDKGWTFYKRNYEGADKQILANRLRSILKHQPVYKYFYD